MVVLVVLGMAAVWFVYRFVLALDFLEFGDETEKVVDGWAIAEGGSLYDSVYSNHGPLPFMAAHLVTLATGSHDLSTHRFVLLLAYLLTAGCVFTSPALDGLRRRSLATAGFLVVLGAGFPLWLGHMVNYCQWGGLLLTVLIAQVVLPLFADAEPRRSNLAVGGAAAGLLLGAAYTLAIPVGLLLGASVLLLWQSPDRRRLLTWFATGFVGALLALTTWLTSFGSVRGFLAYHVYLNQLLYPEYSPVHPFAAFTTRWDVLWDQRPDLLADKVALAGMLGWVAVVVVGSWRRRPRWVAATAGGLAVFGLLLADPRGATHDKAATLLIPALGLLLSFVVVVARHLRPRWELVADAAAAVAAVAIAGWFLASGRLWFADLGIDSRTVAANHIEPGIDEGEPFALVRDLTPHGEPIASFMFEPDVYLASDRLPATRQPYYLPTQADYENDPVLGVDGTLCEDLATREPVVIAMDWWVVWDAYPPEDFAGCLVRTLDEDYTRLSPGVLHLRSDLVVDALGTLYAHGVAPATGPKEQAPVESIRSVPEDGSVEVRVDVPAGRQAVGVALRLGVAGTGAEGSTTVTVSDDETSESRTVSSEALVASWTDSPWFGWVLDRPLEGTVEISAHGSGFDDGPGPAVVGASGERGFCTSVVLDNGSVLSPAGC